MDKNFDVELKILDILEAEFCISLRMAEYTEGVISCAKNQALEKMKPILKQVSEEAERRGKNLIGKHHIKSVEETVILESEIASLKEQLEERTRERDDVYEKLTAEIRELKREKDDCEKERFAESFRANGLEIDRDEARERVDFVEKANEKLGRERDEARNDANNNYYFAERADRKGFLRGVEACHRISLQCETAFDVEVGIRKLAEEGKC